MADLASVGAIILAAGSSRRLGRPKQLLDLDDRPLLQHVIGAAAAAGVGEIVLVLGHLADQVTAAITVPSNARIVVNHDFATGQASSLRTGLRALGPQIDRALILLGDQPHVAVAALDAVALGPGPIRRIRYRDGPGHPVAFDRELWERLLTIEGDQGARQLVEAHPDLIHEVDLDVPMPRDVDTDADATEIGAAG